MVQSTPAGATHFHARSGQFFKATDDGVQYFERGQWHDGGHWAIGVIASGAAALNQAAVDMAATYFKPRTAR